MTPTKVPHCYFLSKRAIYPSTEVPELWRDVVVSVWVRTLFVLIPLLLRSVWTWTWLCIPILGPGCVLTFYLLWASAVRQRWSLGSAFSSSSSTFLSPSPDFHLCHSSCCHPQTGIASSCTLSYFIHWVYYLLFWKFILNSTVACSPDL